MFFCVAIYSGRKTYCKPVAHTILVRGPTHLNLPHSLDPSQYITRMHAHTVAQRVWPHVRRHPHRSYAHIVTKIQRPWQMKILCYQHDIGFAILMRCVLAAQICSIGMWVNDNICFWHTGGNCLRFHSIHFVEPTLPIVTTHDKFLYLSIFI